MEKLHLIQQKSPTDLTRIPRLLYRRRKLICGFTLVAMISAVVFSFLQPNFYVSRGSLLPTGNQANNGAIGSLASALPGLDLTKLDADPMTSSQLFPDILRSDVICTRLLEAPLPNDLTEEIQARTIADAFGSSFAQSLAGLRTASTVAKDKTTNVITLSVETENAKLAQFVAAAYFRELDEYASSERFARLDENRIFIAARLNDAERRLRDVEDSLLNFRERNRNFYSSTAPDLQLEQGRWERKVEEIGRVCGLLTEQLEMATIEAKRKKPIVAVLDMPTVPPVKAGPHRLTNILQVTLAALIVISGGIVSLDYFRNYLSESDLERLDRLEGEIRTRFRGVTNRMSTQRKVPA